METGFESTIRALPKAFLHTLLDRSSDILTLFSKPATQAIKSAIPVPKVRWVTSPLWTTEAIDGAILGGESRTAGAKYAIPKGLPSQGERSLAIENEPHEVDGFSGEILSGYGKGTKTLLADEVVAIKIDGTTKFSRMNYHVHNADRAGLHYDLSIADVPPGTRNWELNIPRGTYAGRYAFRTTDKGIIVIPMKDRGVVIPKPEYRLKSLDFLRDVVGPNMGNYIVERKEDGSLGNVHISDVGRASIRSHREGGKTYYDKLPALEWIKNDSPFWVLRTLDPIPDLGDTILKVELVHPDGASRVAGILNSYPDKAFATQARRGAVQAAAWDIIQLRGRDLATLPYGQRRAILEDVIKTIRLYNKNWRVIEKCPQLVDPVTFYEYVINDPRGMPYSEGVVVKPINGVSEPWFKVKNRDFTDLIVIEINEGTGKYKDTVGVMVVEDPITHGRGEVGSFSITDAERQWIWNNKHNLTGAIAKVLVMDMTKAGRPRAGTFHSWHPDPRLGKLGNEMALEMYADSLAGNDLVEAKSTKYALKSAAGWRK